MPNENVIRNEAAEWVLRLHESNHSTFAVQQWRKWMAQSPDHQDVFNKTLELWSMSDLIESAPYINKQIPVFTPKHSTNKIQSEPDKTTSVFISLPGRAIAASLFIMVLISASWLGYQHHANKSQDLLFSAHYETITNEHQLITLPDDSLIELGAKSIIDIIYKEGYRKVILHSGEGYFDIAKDKNRPFVVFSDYSLVQAIGTAFNVHKSVDKTTVTVVEGVVQINAQQDAHSLNTDAYTKPNGASGDYSRLIVGETASVSVDGSISPISHIDPERETAWRYGQLVFVNANLETIIADLNRYSELNIRIEHADIAAMRFTGTVLKDAIENWINALPKVFNVQVLYKENQVLISRTDDA